MSDPGYSAREIAELLGWPVQRVRALARDGTVPAGRDRRGRYRFAFGDLVVLRAVKELLDAGVGLRRVKRSLRSLRRYLPDGRPLSTVRLATLGNRVTVRDGAWWFEPDSGQGVLPLAEREASPARVIDAPGRDSDAAYHRGLELEDSDPEAAEAAYLEAIARDDRHADAHINLGRLLQLRGQAGEAERHYRAALQREPGHALARFNLGTVLEESGRIDAAIEHYRACAPDLPDAHYNLAQLYERLGRRAEAIAHLKALKLTCH